MLNLFQRAAARRWVVHCLSLCLALCLSLGQLHAASDRIALVFGMADYRYLPPLTNTKHDAEALSQTLEEIGFDVTLSVDASGAEMQRLLDDFAFKSEVADLALIYFAGHGIEVQGENFMIPVDANVASNMDVQSQSPSLKNLLAAVDRARKMRIVILDSCRDNPLGDAIDLAATEVSQTTAATGTTRGGGGLAPAKPDRGTLVAFAAKDGQVALDGTGNNSPFALALMDKMTQPGLEISLMFRQIRDSVLDRTGNQQEPHTYGSLTGVPFYLAGPGTDDPVLDASKPSEAWASLRPDQEEQLLALADLGDTRSMLGLAYMRLNPNEGRFDPKAAVDFLTRAAAELNFADAINDLGFMYYQGGLGLPADPGKALQYFERAADLRHPQAQFNFAALIDDGHIPSKGPEEAARYLYEALRSGSQDVLNLLSERPTMFTLETRQALQVRLKDNRFYTGAIDGDFGPGTRRSIRRAYGIEDS